MGKWQPPSACLSSKLQPDRTFYGGVIMESQARVPLVPALFIINIVREGLTSKMHDFQQITGITQKIVSITFKMHGKSLFYKLLVYLR